MTKMVDWSLTIRENAVKFLNENVFNLILTYYE